MRILLANRRATPASGGVENSLYWIASTLQKAGHEVAIFALDADASAEFSHHQHANVDVFLQRCRTSRFPRIDSRRVLRASTRGISRLIDEFRPDAIWTRSIAMAHASTLCHFSGARVHIFCTTAKLAARGHLLQASGLPIWQRAVLAAKYFDYISVMRSHESVALRTHRCVTFSAMLQRELMAEYGPAAKSVVVSPPGVNTSVFKPIRHQASRSVTEAILGASSGEPYVLYVGRIKRDKGLFRLVTAMSYVPGSVKLVLVGGGNLNEALLRHAARLGISDRLRFTGPQSESLAGLYSAARVLVLPSTTETFGQVLIESLACGTPVIGLSGREKGIFTASSEIIADGETGAIVNSRDPRHLAVAIQRFLMLPAEQYEAMSRKAVTHVRDRYSWQALTEQLLSLSSGPSIRGKSVAA